MEGEGEGLCGRVGVVVKGRDAVVGGARCGRVLLIDGHRGECETHCCIERAARAGL